MKKFVFLVLSLVTLVNAGWVTSVQSIKDAEIKTEKRGLETYGLNPRAYVFTVDKQDGAVTPMQCIIVYTEQDLGEKNGKSTSPVMQCIKLEK